MKSSLAEPIFIYFHRLHQCFRNFVLMSLDEAWSYLNSSVSSTDWYCALFADFQRFFSSSDFASLLLIFVPLFSFFCDDNIFKFLVSFQLSSGLSGSVFLRNFWWISEELLTYFRRTFDELPKNFRWISEELSMNFRRTFDEFPTNFRWIPKKSLWISDEFPINFEWIPDEFLVNS